MSGKKTINLVDFKKQYKSIEKEIDKSIKKVLKSGWYVLGEEVKNFEKELGKFIGTRYALGVASGTDALTIAIKSLGLKKGDGVIVPANSYPSVFGVSLSGVDIQLSDVDEKTLNINLESIKMAVTKKTKAIVLVHLYGNPVDLDPILKFAKEKKLFVIEDCAQSIGAKYKGKKVGGFGDVSCFSFYPTKNLGACGDGGAILTNSKNTYERAKFLRMYGEKGRYDSVLLGHNSRLDELQAAILRTKLKMLNNWNKKRRELALYYKEKLDSLPIEIVEETKNAKSAYHLFVIKTKNRNELLEHLKKQGINCGIHYPVPIHKTKTFKNLSNKKFLVSENASKKVISLPLFPEMTKNDINYIVKQLKEYFGK